MGLFQLTLTPFFSSDSQPQDDSLNMVDGLPMPTCKFVTAFSSRCFKGEAAYGYYATKKEHFYEFRGHLVINSLGVYPTWLETWPPGRFKAPGFASRNSLCISNTEGVARDEPRELSSGLAAKFRTTLGITTAATFTAANVNERDVCPEWVEKVRGLMLGDKGFIRPSLNEGLAKRGSRPRLARQQRFEYAYIFGAVCPGKDEAVGLVMPIVNREAMLVHLERISP